MDNELRQSDQVEVSAESGNNARLDLNQLVSSSAEFSNSIRAMQSNGSDNGLPQIMLRNEQQSGGSLRRNGGPGETNGLGQQELGRQELGRGMPYRDEFGRTGKEIYADSLKEKGSLKGEKDSLNKDKYGDMKYGDKLEKEKFKGELDDKFGKKFEDEDEDDDCPEEYEEHEENEDNYDKSGKFPDKGGADYEKKPWFKHIDKDKEGYGGKFGDKQDPGLYDKKFQNKFQKLDKDRMPGELFKDYFEKKS